MRNGIEKKMHMVTELRLRWQRALQHWETKMMILSSFARDFKIHQHCSSTCWKTVALNKCFALSIFYNSSHARAFDTPTSQREWEREGSGSCSCPITNSGHWETTLQLLSSPTAPTAPQLLGLHHTAMQHHQLKSLHGCTATIVGAAEPPALSWWDFR